MNKNREKELLREVDRLAFFASAVIIVLLGLAYFGLETSGVIDVAKKFLQGVILNLIPVFVIFAVSYALLRRIQSIKSEHETEELAYKIAEQIQSSSNYEPAIASKSQGSLIQNLETKLIYLVDNNGLKRPINDSDTMLYLAEMLGYQLDNIPQIDSTLINPVGPEVKSYRRWSPPRTREDDISFDAQSAFTLLRRRIRIDEGQRVLGFFFRNNSKDSLKIVSAELMLSMGAPLSTHDISPKNTPSARGLTTCKLLFDGRSEAKEVVPQEDTRLDLFLTRSLSKDDVSSLESVSLGYIAIGGVYRETQVKFHVQC